MTSADAGIASLVMSFFQFLVIIVTIVVTISITVILKSIVVVLVSQIIRKLVIACSLSGCRYLLDRDNMVADDRTGQWTLRCVHSSAVHPFRWGRFLFFSI
jgi:hypothetical protein